MPVLKAHSETMPGAGTILLRMIFMTTMLETTAAQDAIQNMNEVQDAAQTTQAKTCPAKRRKYSGNDVLRLMKVLDNAKMDMERQCLSMNDVVHLVQDKLEGMLKTRKCSCADLARIITSAGFPVTERTLKDYLARSRKDAKEGNDYSELRQAILSQAPKEDGKREDGKSSANDAGPCLASEDGAIDNTNTNVDDGQDNSDEFALPGGNDWLASAISSAMDSNETKALARQHVQDIYAARKRRKKARKHK